MTNSFRTVAFRSVAGLLAIGLLLFVYWLLDMGASGNMEWRRVLPRVIANLLFAVALGLYAFGVPGPFNRGGDRGSAP